MRIRGKSEVRQRYFLRLFIYFVTIGFLPVLLFGVISHNIAYSTAKRQLEQQAGSTANSIAAELQNYLTEYGKLMKTLAEDEKILDFVERGYAVGETAEHPSERTEAALYKLYSVMSSKTDYVAAHIVSSSFRAGISTASVPVNYLPPYNKDWGIFRKASESDAPVIRTNDHNQNALRNVRFSIATAIREPEGEIAGYVVFDVFERMLDDLVAKFSLPYHMDVYLVDSYHFVIYSTAPQLSGRTLDLLPDYLRAVADGAGSPGGYTEQEAGEAYLIAASLDQYGVRVVGEMPLYSAVETSNYVKTAALFAGAVSTLLCIAFTLIAWNDVSRPIYKLTNAIERVESGDLTARVDMENRSDEFGQLGKNFNRMTARVENLILNVEEKQQRLRIAESSALQAQINPHFLYNTLDLIKWNAKLNNMEDVTKITVLLGKLLRSMADFHKDVVTVAEERELIDRYLDIQRIHYGERLVIDEQIPEEVLPLRIPKLMLQPVVENAIVHGIDNQQRACRLTIGAVRRPPYILFRIEDDGSGIDPKTLETLLVPNESKPGGIGLCNVDKRARLYGDATCGLQISSTVGSGTCVTLRIKELDAAADQIPGGGRGHA